ncbi:TonB-dependent receptor [Mongoliibacter ruber]|uniref:Outer membrane receptor for ferrienterochelin and colicins n=1 Tax=Mongoliibacter ruber TaxID=1750599 RepID=A0A2T0WDA7_9BACT|nr:TonB-dependent receptor [Mongoliibacter ruber]PRY84636.1 outer membrane receptor for ferrienterochelin and colicins [Mongoliibacter ruber]
MIRIDLNKIKLLFLFLLILNHEVLADQLKGIVLDQNEQPVPFATIQTTEGKGTVANEKGDFILERGSGEIILVVQALGYERKKQKVSPDEDFVQVVLLESMANLDEVVITGNFDAQSARQSVYQVRSIDKEVIQKRAAGNIQEVLNTELGIRFSQDNALGSSNLEMLGMSGQNVKILIDGVPMVGRQGVSNEININQIDINQIERIEIIEGPMSVMYGADALAGVINIITKRASGSKGYNLSLRIQEETVGNSYSPFIGAGNHIRSIQGNHSNGGALSIGGSFTQNRFGGWKGRFTGRQFEWLPRDQNLLSSFIAYRKGALELDYSIDFLDEDIFSYGPENRVENIDSEFQTSRWMHRLQARIDASEKFKLSVQTAYTDFNRETVTWITNQRSSERSLSQAPNAQSRLQYQGLTLRTTGHWIVSDKFNLQPGIDINTENGVGDRISSNEGIQDYAVFLSSEIVIKDKLKIRPGLRKAYNSAYEAPPIIPSLNTKWSITEKLNVRLAYANGFRAPSIRELYFDFFDASHSISGNPDLRAETSHSFNGSLNFLGKDNKAKQYSAVLTGFYNQVQDQIAFGVDPVDPRITTLFNIEEFRTMGGTFNQTFRYMDWNASLGLARIGRFNRLSGQSPEVPTMLFSTEINANLDYRIKAIDTFISIFYKYTGRLPGFEMASDGEGGLTPREIELQGFHWMDVSFRKNLLKDLQVQLGARNLMNLTNIQSTAAAGSAHGGGPQRPMGYGRSYFIGITYQLSQ